MINRPKQQQKGKPESASSPSFFCRVNTARDFVRSMRKNHTIKHDNCFKTIKDAYAMLKIYKVPRKVGGDLGNKGVNLPRHATLVRCTFQILSVINVKMSHYDN